LDQLVADRVEARYDELARVRAERDNLKREIDDVTAQANAIAEEARRSPDDVRKDLAAAKATSKAKAADLQEAREQRAILERHRDQRKLLAETLKGKDQELKVTKLLAELLGKDRLQLHLMRTAEKQIVQHANSILDRLSGGQLFLKLAPGKDGTGADTALDMEAFNRQTGGAPINVTFLSGSQRFRIAVSLALAIGQYASKQHRPIESVIIDEGFGCLDRNGRQVMIQELQNLRGHLECILLVSHQEEFAEAFPDGYKFELADGSARVTRFQQ
jgi:DNA repair protein SbcC/Rad50